MALIPLLLDLVDDIYENVDRPQRRRGEIPMILVPQSRGLLNHHGIRHLGALQKIPHNADEFQTIINVQSFKPEEVSVKVKGREILIEGKHEEREDEHGFISRQFTRRYILPDAYDIETVATYLDADGKMIVKAQKPKVIEGHAERVIPIERVTSVTKKTEGIEEKKKTEAEYKLEDVIDVME